MIENAEYGSVVNLQSPYLSADPDSTYQPFVDLNPDPDSDFDLTLIRMRIRIKIKKDQSLSVLKHARIPFIFDRYLKKLCESGSCV